MKNKIMDRINRLNPQAIKTVKLGKPFTIRDLQKKKDEKCPCYGYKPCVCDTYRGCPKE